MRGPGDYYRFREDVRLVIIVAILGLLIVAALVELAGWLIKFFTS